MTTPLLSNALAAVRANPTVVRSVVLGAGAAAAAISLYRRRAASMEREASAEAEAEKALYSTAADAAPKRKKKGARVDREFFRRLRRLLRIVMPSLWCKEAGLVALHTGLLLSRTGLSMYISRLDGLIVKAIVDRNARAFFFRLLRWLLTALPAVYVNSSIRYVEGKIALAFRSRLVDHAYAAYMRSETYYRVGNLDSRIENPDQCMTTDVAAFSDNLARLYSQTTKPLFDLVLITSQLMALARARTGGAGGIRLYIPGLLGGAVVASTFLVLRWATPPFGRLVAEEARRYGHLRAVHARLITHSEEVAFYGGERVEESALRRAYLSFVRHKNRILSLRLPYVALEQLFLKYVWSSTGLVMIALPGLMAPDETPAGGGGAASAAAASAAAETAVSLLHDNDASATPNTVSGRTMDFVTARSMLVTAADALERLIGSHTELGELSGHTQRVWNMVDVFDDVAHGRYVKTSTEGAYEDGARGEVVDGANFVELEGVPVVTPNGDVLVRSLSFRIDPGQHTVVTGPNGCGKSSLFRMIGGLWEVRGGRLTKPARRDVFYVPQRPYLTAGTLRDQILYPHTADDMRARGLTDEALLEILEIVDLGSVVTREGGLDAVSDWRDVLSGGEKQRVGLSRVFYHKPSFAILDECTSAVSLNVEASIYLTAQRLGVTLLTVTHRPSLYKFHSHLLQFDGQGNYQFGELNGSTRVTMEEERGRLAKMLADMPRLKARYEELSGLLGHNQ